jgi:hypothetical protein
MTDSAASDNARLYQSCDRRFLFVWTTDDQPEARWHGLGEGPCHYLATSPKGAWAEVIRHEAITEPEELEDLDRALWQVGAPTPTSRPQLSDAVLVGGQATHPQCQAEARRLRNAGARGLVAPSAALLSRSAEIVTVDESGMTSTKIYPCEVVVLFAPVQVVGIELAEGHYSAEILDDVRPLQ